jgi:hypothetical protein
MFTQALSVLVLAGVALAQTFSIATPVSYSLSAKDEIVADNVSLPFSSAVSVEVNAIAP